VLGGLKLEFVAQCVAVPLVPSGGAGLIAGGEAGADREFAGALIARILCKKLVGDAQNLARVSCFRCALIEELADRATTRSVPDVPRRASATRNGVREVQ
jgi:hypothetical protein